MGTVSAHLTRPSGAVKEVTKPAEAVTTQVKSRWKTFREKVKLRKKDKQAAADSVNKSRGGEAVAERVPKRETGNEAPLAHRVGTPVAGLPFPSLPPGMPEHRLVVREPSTSRSRSPSRESERSGKQGPGKSKGKKGKFKGKNKGKGKGKKGKGKWFKGKK